MYTKDNCNRTDLSASHIHTPVFYIGNGPLPESYIHIHEDICHGRHILTKTVRPDGTIIWHCTKCCLNYVEHPDR